jgi:hypothetical protein
MVDVDHLIRDELDRLAPGDGRAPADWEQIARRAAPRTPSPRRVRIALAAAIVLAAVALPTLALSADVRELLGFGPSPAVLDEATHIVSAPVGNGFFVHWWHSPSTTGGSCTFQTVDHSPEPPATPTWMGGGSCGSADPGFRDRARAEHPLNVGFSISRRPPKVVPPRWVPPHIHGSVYEGLRAARVQVEWNGGRLPLVLREGYFLGGSPRLYMPPFAAFPFWVVAYDAQGREVARKKLESPALRLTKGGWKAYAREYLAWKESRRRKASAP